MFRWGVDRDTNDERNSFNEKKKKKNIQTIHTRTVYKNNIYY